MSESEKDLHFLGEFDKWEKVYKIYPNGGTPGDYVVVAGEKEEWNEGKNKWGDFGDDISSRENQTVEGNLSVGHDLTVGNKITADEGEFDRLKVGLIIGDPVYSDDVEIYDLRSDFPKEGNRDKLYFARKENKIFSWENGDYVVASASLELGEGADNAYPGDKGKQNTDDIAVLGKNKLDKIGNSSETTVEFTEALSRENITTGEKQSSLFGKIRRFFTDLKKVAFTGSYNDLSDKPTIPTKVSQLTNDSAFITALASDLTNYYLKTQTYTRDEVQALISNIKTASFEVVDALPATGQENVIYLVPKEGAAPDTHDEYIWVEGAWELIGNTQIDLSNYLQKTGDSSDTTVTFVQESGELASGAKQKTLWGRVAKKIADIVSGAIQVGKANYANSLQSDKNFYLGYDGADGIDSPHVILGATATDSYNQSTIKRILPSNLTVGMAVNDENGNNIPKTYAKKSEVTAVKVGARNYITGIRDNWEGGIVNSDGTITTGNNYNQVTKDYQDIAFLAGKTATASVNPDDVISGSERLKLSFRIAFYTLDYLFISYESSDYNIAYKTFTIPENAAWCKVSVGVGVYGYVSGNFDKVRFQLELGNKETDYSPAPQDIPYITGEYPGMKVGKATSDGNGDNIPNTYYKKAGDVLTGTMKQKKQNSVILLDQASMYIPSGHKGWIALDFGLDSVTVMGEIYLYKYGWGGIVIDFSGYTYVGTGGANNWHVPRYGVRGSIAVMPEIAFAKDNATGKRYILIGGDDFVWGNYDYIALTRIVLGSIDNDTRNRTWAFSALTGTLAALGMTAVWTGGPSYCIEVDKARTAIKADQDKDGNDIPATYATKAQLPIVTYSDSEPANPKNGDIWIVPTD